MFKNLFWFERALRAALGAVMLALAVYGDETILYVIGGVFFATGALGFCPIRLAAGLPGIEPAAQQAVHQPPAPPRNAKTA